MTPQTFTDELGQHHCWTYWRNHYCVGISHDRAESEKRWKESVKVAQG